MMKGSTRLAARENFATESPMGCGEKVENPRRRMLVGGVGVVCNGLFVRFVRACEQAPVAIDIPNTPM
jgi:hypothetical protein